MSTNSTSINHLTNIVSSRNKQLGLNLSAKQAVTNVPNGFRTPPLIVELSPPKIVK